MYPALMYLEFICESATSKSNVMYCILLKVADILFVLGQ